MVDVIIALLLAAGAYLGYKRGLIMQIFYLGTIVLVMQYQCYLVQDWHIYLQV